MTVQIKKQDHVCTILINRPEVKNAVDGPTAAKLARAFREFEQDDDLTVAVLGGTGNTFCAGSDTRVFHGFPSRLLPSAGLDSRDTCRCRLPRPQYP